MYSQNKGGSHFRSFADFLLKNHLSDLSVEVLAKVRSLDLPILKLLAKYSEEQILELQKQRWMLLLTSIVNGNEMEDVERRIKEWQELRTPLTASDFSPIDTSLAYSAQKYTLLKMLPFYTQELSVYQELVLIIDDFYTQVNKIFYTSYLDYQKETLTKEKEFVETLVDNSIDEILAFDKDLRFTAWNKRLEDNVGIRKEDVLRKHIFDVFPNYKETEEGVKFLEVLNGKKVSFSPIYYPTRKKHIQMNIVPLFYGEEIIGGLTIARDVTEFKEIEAQLTEREKFITNITSSIPHLIYVFDLLENKNLYINRSAISYLGYSEEQIKELGDSILNKVMHPEERELLAAHFELLGNSPDGTVHGFEYRMRRADGAWRWFFCNDTLFKRTEDGLAWQVLGTSQDITEKKEAELLILRSELINKEIQALAHIGHYEWTATSNTITWSDELFRIYGYEPGELELTSENIERLTIPTETKALRDELLQQLYLNPGSYDYEHVILKKDGSKGVISGKVIGYPDSNGKLIKVTGYSQDITEKYLSEQKLRENEHFNKMLTKSSPNLIFVYDLISHSLIYGNKSIEEFLGYPIEVIAKLGPQTVQTLIHPDDVANVMDHLQKMGNAKSNEIFIIEYRLKDHTGNYKWIRSHETIFKMDEQDRPLQVIGNSQDITNSKETRQALADLNMNLEERIKMRTQELEDSRKQIKLIIDSIPALISYVDKNERYAFVNKTYTSWYEQDSDIFVGRTVKEVSGDSVYPILEPQVRKVLNGEVVHYDTDISYPTGHRSVQVTYVPDKNTEGEINGFVVLVNDVSNQKKLEDELRQREKEIRLIADSIPASISYIDKGERYIFANKTSILWNGKGEKLLGMTVAENLVEVYPDVKPYLIQCLNGQLVSYDLSYEHNNTQKESRIQYIPDISTSGETRGFVCLIMDISEDKRKENDLKRKNEELLKINGDLDNFIYTASHDLKAPVSNIEGLITNLSETLHEENCVTDEIQFVINLMKESVKRFQGVIGDLADIAKIQRNIQEDIETINLEEMIGQIIKDLTPLIKQSGATINIDLKDSSILQFSKLNMRSILHNLISNAIKYRSSERMSIVSISCCKFDGNFVLEVQDNGLGIREDQKEKIFQMFKRLHNHVEGTGIGLYIVKRIVENANGKIELESELDKGSLFRIFLPL